MKSSEIPRAQAPDRRTGLVIFGSFDCVAGLVYLIRALTLFFLVLTGAGPRPDVLSAGEIAVSALLALIPAAFFLTVGIGSMLGRRWARSLSFVFSTVWLVFDALTIGCLLTVLPGIVSAAGRKVPFPLYGSVIAFGILLPAAYVLFYGSGAVKAACEELDPQERWTDRCSAFVLASVIFLVVGAALELGLGFSGLRQRIFFGRVFGPDLRMALSAAAAVQLAAAANLPRGKTWAWAAALAMTAARAVEDVVLARSVNLARFESAVSSVRRLSERDAALLGSIGSLHLRPAVTGYVVLLGLISVAVVARAGKGLRTIPGNRG
ncbi:MAG: hypothetical protein ACRD16_04960 [Thermoanaerobaculia bacterium]